MLPSSTRLLLQHIPEILEFRFLMMYRTGTGTVFPSHSNHKDFTKTCAERGFQ